MQLCACWSKNSVTLKGRKSLNLIDGEYRTCQRCGEEKPNDFEHFIQRRHKSGTVTTGSYCLDCKEQEKIDSRGTSDRAKRLVETRELRLSGKKSCSNCGEIKPLTKEHFYSHGQYGGFMPKCINCMTSGKIKETARLFDAGVIRCNECFEEKEANETLFSEIALLRPDLMENAKNAKRASLTQRTTKSCFCSNTH